MIIFYLSNLGIIFSANLNWSSHYEAIIVVASATAGGNSICVAQLPPDIRCQ